MMLQLNPMIPVTTPRGRGFAMGWLDYSQEHHLIWIVTLDENGEVWSFQNDEITVQANITMRRTPCPAK